MRGSTAEPLSPWSLPGTFRLLAVLGCLLVTIAVTRVVLRWDRLPEEPLLDPAEVAVPATPVGRPAPPRLADIDPPAPATPPPAPPAVGIAAAEAAIADHKLLVPVLGVQRQDLRDSFLELRGSTRHHQAMDILAPRNTPVVAVEDGTIAKLFNSKRGGLTVYQMDPTATYIYLYAHLEKYAAGLREGAGVKRGQIIGFVGTSGNAPPDTPHLHFAIERLGPEKRWWQGTPINPFQVLR